MRPGSNREPVSQRPASRHETGIGVTVAALSQTETLMIRFWRPPTIVSPAKMTTGHSFVAASIVGTVPPPSSRSSRSPRAVAAVAVS